MSHLKNISFAEPPEVQRRRLASEFSTMKQRTTESIDCFAYRFKNNLHRLSKLREPVESNSPQFIMSQFISKTKTNIDQKHLVLKPEEYKDLSEIIEAAKRIERSFSPGGHSNTNKPPLDPPNALNTTPIPPVPEGRRRKPFCYQCHSPSHIKSSCPKRTVKTPPLAILSVAMKCVACGTNISSHHAPYKTSYANMAEHISVPFAPNQDARHSFTIMSLHLLLMHVIFKHHRIPALSPAALLHHLLLVHIPSQPHLCFRFLLFQHLPANYLSI